MSFLFSLQLHRLQLSRVSLNQPRFTHMLLPHLQQPFQLNLNHNPSLLRLNPHPLRFNPHLFRLNPPRYWVHQQIFNPSPHPNNYPQKWQKTRKLDPNWLVRG